MACACKNKKQGSDSPVSFSEDITVEPVTVMEEAQAAPDNTQNTTAAVFATNSQEKSHTLDQVIAEANEINLKQCYLCTKKHIERAREFFEEYHTGYPDHVKNLIESLRVSEKEVMQAFLLWQRVMGQLNMSEGELLGNDANKLQMKQAHIALANGIRNERLKLSDNPLYIPDFDRLLVSVHLLQHRTMDNNGLVLG